MDGRGARGSRPTKRARTAAACDLCRARKIKCEGKPPVCDPCRKQGGSASTCIWRTRKSRGAAISREEISRLQKRIEELESQSRAASSSSAITELASIFPVQPSPLSNDEEERQIPDANAMMGMQDDQPCTTSKDLVDSSANSFIRQMANIITRQSVARGGQRQSQQPVNHSSVSPSSAGSMALHEPSSHLLRLLPSPQETSHLLKIYWRLKATMFPILDKDEFESAYASLLSDQLPAEPGQIFVCMLNVMLSIAAMLNSEASSSERLRQANSCYQRAQALLDMRILHSRSVLAVQCFLLLASYLQSTNDSQQCWLYVGQAIRLAQSLELDRPGTSANAASPQIRENFRRVWYGCVFMDRMLSLAFGRQPILSFKGSNNVPLPRAHASGNCRCFTTMPTDVPDAQEIHFFVESIKYYELISQTLQALYSATTEVGNSDDLYTIFFGAPGPKTVGYLAEIDHKLRGWRQALPFQLGQDANARKSEVHARQATALWLRDHYIRILMLRPILARFCAKESEFDAALKETMPWQLAHQFSILCIRTALEVVDFFNSVIDSQMQKNLEDIAPAWWYSVLYMYTATSTLVAARISPTILETIPETTLLEAWQSVTKVFRKFASYSQQATQALASADALFSKASPNDEGNRSGTRGTHMTNESSAPPATPLSSTALESRMPSTEHGWTQYSPAWTFGHALRAGDHPPSHRNELHFDNSFSAQPDAIYGLPAMPMELADMSDPWTELYDMADFGSLSFHPSSMS